jgi:hypothetical protein
VPRAIRERHAARLGQLGRDGDRLPARVSRRYASLWHIMYQQEFACRSGRGRVDVTPYSYFHGTDNPNIVFAVRNSYQRRLLRRGVGVYFYQSSSDIPVQYALTAYERGEKHGTPVVYECVFSVRKPFLLSDEDDTYGMDYDEMIEWTDDKLAHGYDVGIVEKSDGYNEVVIWSKDASIHVIKVWVVDTATENLVCFPSSHRSVLAIS